MNQFEISRTINASCDEIFAAWTIDNQLEQWWAPYGFELSIFKLDLSIGGVFHYKMATVDGYEMWGRFVYTDFRKPNKLVFINSFADQKGKVMRAPFSDEWPLEIRNELTIIAAGKQSIVSLKVNPVNATAIEIQTFQENMESLGNGFAGTFDRLMDFLKKR